MANLKVSPVSYRPFKVTPIMQDGLLAVERSGGEVAAAVGDALFNMADMFKVRGDRAAARKGEEAARAAVDAASPRVSVSGGTRQPGGIEESPVTGVMADSLNATNGNPIVASITKAAMRHGQSAKALLRFAKIESNFNPKAKNPESSAGGLFQFVDGTAAQYALEDRFDADQSSDAAARLMRDNTAYLAKGLGRDPTIGELYLAHQQGAAGALKLLTNPGKLAREIVGAEAVTKNGGTLSMTAGDFARLWTSKAGDEPIGAASMLGPMPEVDFSVDPLEGPRDPLQVSVSGGAPARVERDTIYGRAFNRVASATYMQRLQDEMTDGAATIAQTFKDDPEGMREAFSELRRAQLASHVTPEIRGDFDAAFNKLERSYLRSAQEGRETELKKQREAKWDGQAQVIADSLDDTLERLDPGNDDSRDLAQAEVHRYKNFLRNGVAQGFISEAKAREAAGKAEDLLASSWYVRQAKGKSAEEIDALRVKMEEDFKAGKLEGVSGAAWRDIETGLKGAASEWTRQDATNKATFASLTEDILNRAAAGHEVPAEDMAALERAAANLEDGEELMSATRETLNVGRMLRDRPIGEAETRLAELRKSFGASPSKIEAATLAGVEAMIVKARKSLSDDLLGHASRVGIIGDVPAFADVKTPEQMKEVIAARVAAGAKAAAHFGVAERFFRPGEVEALQEMAQANPDAGASFAAAMIEGAKGKTLSMLKEFGKGAPVLAGAGAIIAGGGSAIAARDAIAGSGKTADGKAYSDDGWETRRQLGVTIAGHHMTTTPADMEMLMGTAEAIARKRMADQGIKGIDKNSAAFSEIYERALNEAAGATFVGEQQYGGFADYDPSFMASPRKVLVPDNIRSDKFGDVVEALKDEDFALKPEGGVAALDGLWPMWTPNGFMFGEFDDQGEFLPRYTERGTIFYVDFDRLAPELGKRVAGAVKGY